MGLFEELRKKHPLFIYHSYELNESGFSFHFSIDQHHFYPCWKFDTTMINKNADRNVIDYAVFNIGMAELVSYWKCACCPEIEVRCGALNNEQISWWKKLYFNGLGEFFYRNGICSHISDFMNIKCVNNAPPVFDTAYNPEGFLIPVGGGKDSVVTLELLKKLGNTDKNTCYLINGLQAAKDTAKTAGYDNVHILSVTRTIDKTLLELNKKGYLNGHTPFSSVIAFSSWLFAYILGKQYIILSNESSANESYVQGKEVNHQYSKSTEFEADFRFYSRKFLLPYPEYFSLLRPWSEWQIAREFVKHPIYFKEFRSCNLGSKANVWCNKCAKCLYIYIMLAAFLDDAQLVDIFGKNLLDDEGLLDIFNGLAYADYDKPFECVGTRDEINLSLSMACERRKNKLPFLLSEYMNKSHEQPISLDNFYDNNNFVPQMFTKLLK